MVAHRGIGTTAWLALLLAAPWAPADAGDDALARANRVLSHTILVDGHNDLPIAIRGYASAPGDLDA